MSPAESTTAAVPVDAAAEMPVDIVIVTYNSAAVLGDCLDAIAATRSKAVGVVVVDNASIDSTLEIARSHPLGACVVSSGGNFGYSAAINIGVRESVADAILILNPDTAVHPGSIDALRRELISSGAGVVAPTIRNPRGERELSIRRFPTALRLLGQSLVGAQRAGRWSALSDFVIDDAAYSRPGNHDWCSGAVLLVSRTCLERVGPWDESFFLYSEETDFCWRAQNAGFATRFVPDAIVHHVGGDSGTSPRLWSILVTNRVRLVLKHRGALHGAAYWFVSVLGELARSFRPRNRAALIALVTGRKDPAVREAMVRHAQRTAGLVRRE